MAIVVNKLIPEFEANATGGIKVTNTSHMGQVLVLYFYPKDNTPGCTTEALQFRDKYKDFVKAGATVFGVSRDNMKSHDDFKAKLELPFELIADTEEKMCHMFGVVKNKIMYGKKVKGIERSTFLIGKDGVLRREWRKLSVDGHAAEVLQALDGPDPEPTKPARTKARPKKKTAPKKRARKKAGKKKAAKRSRK